MSNFPASFDIGNRRSLASIQLWKALLQLNEDEKRRFNVNLCKLIVLTEEHTSKVSCRSATCVLFFWWRLLSTRRLSVPIRGLDIESPERTFNVVHGSRSRGFSSSGPNQQAVSIKESPGLPLSGTLVVALQQATAGTFCTRQLADLEARAVKIERPGWGRL